MRPSINRSMNAREWTMLLMLALLFGSSFFFAAVSLRELPPMTIVWLRVSLAALLLIAVMAAMRLPLPRDLTTWRTFFMMAVVNNVIPFTLLVWGQTRVASGVASIMIATTPIFTSIFAHVVTHDEKLTVLRAIGVGFGIAGVVVMIGGASLTEFSGSLAGELAVLGTAIAYACSSIFARRFNAMGVPPLTSATGLLIAASILCLPLALVADWPINFAWPSRDVVLAVLGFGVLSTGLAYILYFKIVATAGATNLMLVTFLMPVVAISMGVLLLHETLELRHIAGMALIAVGLVTIDGRLLRALRKPAVSPAE
ncbi:MAG: DMT family transporter [Xanthobacteraceae bacterium]